MAIENNTTTPRSYTVRTREQVIKDVKFIRRLHKTRFGIEPSIDATLAMCVRKVAQEYGLAADDDESEGEG